MSRFSHRKYYLSFFLLGLWAISTLFWFGFRPPTWLQFTKAQSFLIAYRNNTDKLKKNQCDPQVKIIIMIHLMLLLPHNLMRIRKLRTKTIMKRRILRMWLISRNMKAHLFTFFKFALSTRWVSSRKSQGFLYWVTLTSATLIIYLSRIVYEILMWCQ